MTTEELLKECRKELKEYKSLRYRSYSMLRYIRKILYNLTDYENRIFYEIDKIVNNGLDEILENINKLIIEEENKE